MLAIAILAAGKGTRMRSNKPKVLQNLCGITLVERVLNVCKEIQCDRKFLVIGHQAELIREKLIHKYDDLQYIIQKEQKGTGHAAQQLISSLEGFNGELLVLNGDVPLIESNTLINLINKHRENKASATIISAKIDNPSGYGRVFADQYDVVKKIIEEKDCDEEQLENKLTNSGIYCFNSKELCRVLPRLSSNNKQGELYLTDVIEMMDKSIHLTVENSNEVSGINDRIQLALCETYIQTKLKEAWMKKGVTFIDSKSSTISSECIFGKDVIIEPQTHFRGKCVVGDGAIIGPHTLIEESNIGSETNIFYSVVKESRIDNNVRIGPFTHIRPESQICNNCRIGNFVEVKKSKIDKNSKLNHLSYIGDSFIGSNVNIGAGTITANYDGKNKHITLIGDRSKTGANSVLVAPIKIGSDVTIAAGSTLTRDVPNNSLAIGRAQQIIKTGWSFLNKS
tara:strand:+ start:319 stop:1677 length:1359 start_codon:yes stop_codon:yes gene_type:complete